jgi:NRAMP (natural resistance-associated macrophage protein)-like metal ion transporter
MKHPSVVTTSGASDEDSVKKKPRAFGRFMRMLGPGIVTGAADDDPSGIATYTQAGAQFGFMMPWTMLFTYPFMTIVQEACMRIGAVTGKGLAAVIREHYPNKVLYPVLLIVVCANTLNIGSDIGAMAASIQLLVPAIPFTIAAIVTALFVVMLEVFVPYRTYIRILKWLAASLFAYIITAFLIHVPWKTVLLATLVPHIQFSSLFFFSIVGIFGTTISPYLFFWQASNVVEDEIEKHRLPQRGGVPRLSRAYIRNLRIDTFIGMLFSNVVAWFVIVVAAVVLNQSGTTNISSAADAARALEPLVSTFPYAGFLAKLIFAVGIIGIGLQSIPVLAGSSAYAVAETFGWREGLYRKFNQSRNFYLVIICGTLAGLLFNILGFDPIKALLFTADFNGIASVPLLALIAGISGKEAIMGEYKNGVISRVGLWFTFAVMSLFAAALMVFTFL